jgi:hypothetical protein
MAAASTFATAPPSGAYDVATQGTGSDSCPAGQLPTGSGFSKGDGPDTELEVTSFAPDYRDTPPQWDMTIYSLPAYTVTNTGGSVSFLLVCLAI